MKRSPYYLLKNIEGHYYLFPFSKEAVKSYKTIEINEFGAFVWDCLSERKEFHELSEACAAFCECTSDERPLVDKMLTSFLESMEANRLLDKEISDEAEIVTPASRRYVIANIGMDIHCSQELPFDKFKGFENKGHEEIMAVQDVYLVERKAGEDFTYSCGIFEEKLFESTALNVYKKPMGLVIKYNQSENLRKMTISNDGKTVILEYCNVNEGCNGELEDALRTSYLYLAKMHQIVSFHSAVVFRKNKVWLLLGKSGAGKSTLAKNMCEALGCKIINGDVSLISVKDSLIYYGCPWCGTSEINNNETHELDGIVFVSQGPENVIKEIDYGKKASRMMSRCFSPVFYENMVERNLDMVEQICRSVPAFEYSCVDDLSAARKLDDYLRQYDK